LQTHQESGNKLQTTVVLTDALVGESGANHRGSIVTSASDEPPAQVQAIMERMLGLVRECRLVLRALERPANRASRRAPKPSGFSTTRWWVRSRPGWSGRWLRVLRHAGQPLGPMGTEWLERQEQKLKDEDG